ncbi:MAG: ribosomal-processing cysteine protease Prp [Ruminococcus sp.]|nr:ribosomal-processing cysteine protease Prp [Ruminococcus sp.]
MVISVTFYRNDGSFTGYEFSGHSDYAESGYDIVCSAVSSAAYLTANNITDIYGIKADVTVSDGRMILTAEKSDNLNRLIDGLYRHTLQLAEQYPNDIKVKISEV